MSRVKAIATARNLRTLRPQDRWGTPLGLFRTLDDEFGFEVDVAADAGNALCPGYFDEHVNALTCDWAPCVCWMNPPYSNLDPWTKKAVAEAGKGATVVGLLPARTDVPWFHRDVLRVGAEVRFVQGRIAFNGAKAQSAPFPSVIVVWRPTDNSGTTGCICQTGSTKVCPTHGFPTSYDTNGTDA